MAAGTYKNGVAIIVTYQAVNSATGKTVTMDVYDEAHAKDEAKCVAEMTEVVSTGRYYATFTPDAEGEWIIIMKNTTDNNGEVVKAFPVAGHDMDSVGDAIAALPDAAAINAEVDTALGDYDAPTKAELDSGLAALPDAAAINAEVDTALGDYDAPTKDEMDSAHSTTNGLITTVDTVVDGIQTDLSNGTDGLGAIKDAVDAIASPAMVG